MGITAFSMELIQRVRSFKQITSVCDLGTQQTYTYEYNGTYANKWYNDIGIFNYACIDVNGLNNSIYHDLSTEIFNAQQYDLVTDFGTSEHVANLDMAWLNKYKLCIDGGYIISENPMDGHWHDHCIHYMTLDKVREYGKKLSLEPIAIGISYAMDNYDSGGNVWSIFKKPNG
jgi:hypothetical protein